MMQLYLTHDAELSTCSAEDSVNASLARSASTPGWLDLTAGALHLTSSIFEYAGEDEDVVSETDLIAHLHAFPPRLSFASDNEYHALLGRTAAATVTGAAFAAGLALDPGAIQQFDDMVMTFVDERSGASASLIPHDASSCLDSTAEEPNFILGDRTVIRLTGFVKTWSGKLSGAAGGFGPTGLTFAA